MRTKEYLVAIRVLDGALSLTTMLFHDEVRPTREIPTGGKKPSKQTVDRAVAIIEELSTDWDPASYTDCYRERLKRVIERKRKRQQIEVPTPEKEPEPVPDLMEALERTLQNVKRGRPAREDSGDNGDGRGDLEELSLEELRERAKDADVRGRSKMSRDELVDALGSR
jgi:DNA end-binding protein Ku